MWNGWLTDCLRKRDLPELRKILYGIEAGMADLAKQKLNTQDMILFFIRLQRSIYITMKRVVRERNPNPCDDPIDAMDNPDRLEAKRERDQQFERDFLKSGY